MVLKYKLLILTILTPITVLALAFPSGADQTELDRYFSLRRQSQANLLNITAVKASPSSYTGRIIELRGTLSGSVQNGDNSFFIIDCGDGCYVVSDENLPSVSTGSRVCVLARIGERCQASLSDLRLEALAYYNEVTQREQKALAAEQAKLARAAAAKAVKQEAAREKSKSKRTDPQQSRSGGNINAEQLVAVYKKAIKSYNNKLSDKEADTIARSILGFSHKYQVDPRLVVAVILAESHFRPEVTSHKGAMGLGQLMPGTASGLGVTDAYDPVQNIAGSVRLIKGHLDKLSGNARWTELTWQHLSLALASYNAGSGAVKKYGGVPPYKETRAYINKVISIYKRLCGIN